MARESPRKEFWTTKVRSDESDTLCWKSLGYAIVVQAAEDYREILYRLKKDPTDPMNTDRAVELERFFHSTWYESLCPLDGDYLINALHREVYQLTAKEFLNQPCKINKQISKKLQQLKSLREMATSTTGSMSEMPHSPSSDLQRIESVMALILKTRSNATTKRFRMRELPLRTRLRNSTMGRTFAL